MESNADTLERLALSSHLKASPFLLGHGLTAETTRGKSLSELMVIHDDLHNAQERHLQGQYHARRAR